jgi:hypothetical protein
MASIERPDEELSTAGQRSEAARSPRFDIRTSPSGNIATNLQSAAHCFNVAPKGAHKHVGAALKLGDLVLTTPHCLGERGMGELA